MRYALATGFVLLSLLLPGASLADSPRWSFSLKGGYFMPDIDGWEDQYGHSGSWTVGMELGWQILRQLELSGGVGYFSDEGQALTPSGRQSNMTVTYSQVPVDISLIFQLVLSEDQIVVPYLGGGYSHVFYWEKLNGERASGDRYGYHARGGLRFLLNPLSPEAADDMYQIMGVTNTYFFVEGTYSKLDDFGKEDIALGGEAILGGFRIEF